MINEAYVQLFLKRYKADPLMVDKGRDLATQVVITGDDRKFRAFCRLMRISDAQKELREPEYYRQLAMAAIIAANQIQRAQ